MPLSAGAQTPNNPLLRRGQAEAVLAGQPTTLDWAEAVLQLRLSYANRQVILKELTPLPETPELLLVRGRCNFQIEDLRQAYTQSNGPTRWRAAASLA